MDDIIDLVEDDEPAVKLEQGAEPCYYNDDDINAGAPPDDFEDDGWPSAVGAGDGAAALAKAEAPAGAAAAADAKATDAADVADAADAATAASAAAAAAEASAPVPVAEPGHWWCARYQAAIDALPSLEHVGTDGHAAATAMWREVSAELGSCTHCVEAFHHGRARYVRYSLLATRYCY